MAKRKRTTKALSPAYSHASRLPIDAVTVVGCGGNGSIFVSHLCRIWQAWTALGGEPFTIELWDPDVVTEANLARQCFCPDDIGQNKAAVLAQRMRAFYGIPVYYHNCAWRGEACRGGVLVGCVDSLVVRRKFAKAADTYWLDMGNDTHTGQVVLGGHGLPNLFDVYPHLKRARDKKSVPSCSMAESLSRQDLFINSTLATHSAALLWQLMSKGGINHHGYVVNMSEGLVLPLKINA